MLLANFDANANRLGQSYFTLMIHYELNKITQNTYDFVSYQFSQTKIVVNLSSFVHYYNFSY